MNRVTAIGVYLGDGLKHSRNGVPVATGKVAYRSVSRFARLPLVAFGKLAERLASLEHRPVMVGGYLQEYVYEGGRRMQVTVQEVFPVDLLTFKAPLGHPVVDGYARAEVSGLVARPPAAFPGGYVVRVAVRYPQGAVKEGETFVNLIIQEVSLPRPLAQGDRVYAEGAILGRRNDPDVLDILVGRIYFGESTYTGLQAEVA